LRLLSIILQVHSTVKLNDKSKLSIGLSILALASAVVGFQLFFRGADAADFANAVVCIDAESGKVVKDFVPPAGKMAPWTGRGFTKLYPAERCYYDKDGKVKSEPTYVLVKALLGQEGETLCPDCNRKVTLRNPSPPIAQIEQARTEKR